MTVNYKNWVPKYLILGMGLATVASIAALIVFGICGLWVTQTWRIILGIFFAVAAFGCGKTLQWSITAYHAFSYDGKRQLSRQKKWFHVKVCLPVVPFAIVAGFLSSTLMLRIWQGGIYNEAHPF